MYKLTLKNLLIYLRPVKIVKIIKNEKFIYGGFVFDALNYLDIQTLNEEIDTCDIEQDCDTNLCFKIILRRYK